MILSSPVFFVFFFKISFFHIYHHTFYSDSGTPAIFVKTLPLSDVLTWLFLFFPLVCVPLLFMANIPGTHLFLEDIIINC